MRKSIFGLGIAISLFAIVCVVIFLINPTNSSNELSSSAPSRGGPEGSSEASKDQAKRHATRRPARGANQHARDPDSGGSSRRSSTAVDISELAKEVGDETAVVLAAGGPYEAVHIRTMARSLRGLEKEMRTLAAEDSQPEDMERVSRRYAEIQNHYYKVLNDLEPYKPDQASAQRMNDLEDAIETSGDSLTAEELQALKHELLLVKD